jgi:hypothetical protein
MVSAALVGIFIGLAFAVANGSTDELKKQIRDLFRKEDDGKK